MEQSRPADCYSGLSEGRPESFPCLVLYRRRWQQDEFHNQDQTENNIPLLPEIKDRYQAGTGCNHVPDRNIQGKC